MYVWRISNYATLSGEGSARASGRWHVKGYPIVYTSESAAGALLEILVHLRGQVARLSDFYTLLCIEIPDDLTIETLATRRGLWNEDPQPTQSLGVDWLRSGRSPVVKVPSVVVPNTWNYLLNPRHNLATQIVIAEVITNAFDPRLFR